MAGWNLLFLDERPSDPSKDEEWNRSAYLVESLGHCGSYTRNFLGAGRIACWGRGRVLARAALNATPRHLPVGPRMRSSTI
jgi:hypothetical protein